MSKNYCKVEHKWCKFCKKNKDKSFGCTYTSGFSKDLTEIHKCPKREATETISLRKLLRQCNLYDIMTAMLQSHPNEKKNILGYAHVYEKMQNIKGIKSNGMLSCVKEYFNTYDDKGNKTDIKDSCVSIYGVYNGKEYAIEYVPWGEWATMNIEQDTLDSFTKEEICASALWEMTYNGYTEDSVREHQKKLEDALKECLHNEKV